MDFSFCALFTLFSPQSLRNHLDDFKNVKSLCLLSRDFDCFSFEVLISRRSGNHFHIFSFPAKPPINPQPPSNLMILNFMYYFHLSRNTFVLFHCSSTIVSRASLLAHVRTYSELLIVLLVFYGLRDVCCCCCRRCFLGSKNKRSIKQNNGGEKSWPGH